MLPRCWHYPAWSCRDLQKYAIIVSGRYETLICLLSQQLFDIDGCKSGETHSLHFVHKRSFNKTSVHAEARELEPILLQSFEHLVFEKAK
jgi:hypothetical protein